MADPPLHRFTLRQRQVLKRIGGGMSYGQVARDLGISPETVRVYVRQVAASVDYPHLPPKAAVLQFYVDTIDTHAA